MTARLSNFSRPTVRGCTVRAALTAALLVLATWSAAAPPVSPLRVGIPRAGFSNLNEADAAAAYRTLILSAARHRGYDVQPELVAFDVLPGLEAAVMEGSVQVCVIGTWQLLETRIPEAADVAFVPAANGHVNRRLLLLTRGGGPVQRIGDLRDASALVLRDTRVNLAERWLDSLCLREGLGLAATSVRRLEIVSRPNSALLPVFFGTTDVCIVDEDSFAAACELNPQLRVRLKTIAESPALLDSVICINRHGWPSATHRDDLIRSLAELDREPTGRQLLTMFRVDQLRPYQPELLETVAAMHREFVELTSRLAPAGTR